MKDTSLPDTGAFIPSKCDLPFDLNPLQWPSIPITPTGVITFQQCFGLMPDLRTFEWGGAGGLASGPSCESSSPDVSVLPSCVIAGYFRGLGELARAQRSVVAFDTHVR